MTDKAYVVIGTSGLYDDHTEWCVCVCLDEQMAAKIVLKLRNAIDADFELRCAMAEFIDRYREDHPHNGIPIWEWEASYKKALEDWSKDNNPHADVLLWANEFDTEFSDDGYSGDNAYSYREVPIVEGIK